MNPKSYIEMTVKSPRKSLLIMKWIILLITLTHFSLQTSICFANEDQITLFIQSLEGEKNLGRNVTTILELQIWQTFRKSPTPNPKGISFGRCQIFRNYDALTINGYSEAEAIAKDAHNLAQAILWGKVWEYGNGIVVQSYLSLPLYNDLRETHNEIWSIQFSANSKDFKFEVDLPSRRYEFKPLVLDPLFVQEYSTPLALKIYSKKDHKKVIGYAGREVAGREVYEFTAIKHEDDHVQVISNGKSGWIYLPKISQQNSEIVYFVGGIIRLFRGDWNGTIDLMKRVVNNDKISTFLRADAHLYTSIAKYRLGLPYDTEIEKAFALNPYSKSTVRYRIMQLLDKLRLAYSNRELRNVHAIIEGIKSIVKHNRYLFSDGDAWIRDLADKIKYLGTS